jgi:hypothetical protein
MIFNGYENYFTEQKIDLSRYIGDKNTIENFHDNFFKDEVDKFPDNFRTSKAILSLFNKFSSHKEEKSKNIAEKLVEEGVSSVLLVLPQSFITTIITLKNQNSKERVRPREFSETFMNKFANEFTRNGIDFAFILNKTHTHKNLENLESWLNIKLLQQKIELKTNEAYILGLKDIKLLGSTKEAISLSLKDKNITIYENCSMLLANSELFKYSVPDQDSVVKITNNTSDGYIDITTDGIDNVTTNNKQLQEDLSFGIGQFSIKLNDLDIDDIDLKFNSTTTILLSKNIIEKKERKIEKAKPNQKENRVLVTDTDSDRNNNSLINLKNRYLVNLKKFVIAYEDELTEVHYSLVKVNKQLILVGGSQIDKKEQPIAKIVANMRERTFKLTNLLKQSINFTILENRVEYKTRKSKTKPKNYINTDEEDEPQNLSEVALNNKESYTFDKRIEFSNSAIEFSEDGVEVNYIKFTIGSFNNKLEFNRIYYRHFGTGNIIDSKEHLDYGGRVYSDGNKNILGSILSSKPLILTLREKNFILYNNIKSRYIIGLSTPNQEQELAFQKELTISKDELFLGDNVFSIKKDNINLVEFTIVSN